MDAFYASVEKLDNPDLKDKPLIVGATGKRGVVCTASYEARKYGVASAMSISKAKKLCPQGICLPPRFGRYREISQKIREIFLCYTPKVEPISLDEAFLDLTKTRRNFNSAIKTARRIKGEIWERIGLTCSVGVAPNKFLAKVASDLKKPDGFTVIKEKDTARILENLSVSKIWGVGRVTEKKLEKMGIHTIGQLKELSLRKLRGFFGRQGENLYRLARGIDESPVQSEREIKSISEEITFEEDLKDPERIIAYLLKLSEGVGKSLRENGLRARTVKIKVRYSDFTTLTRQVTLDLAFDSTGIIKEVAKRLFRRKISQGRKIRLIGVGVSNLIQTQEEQLSLFQTSAKVEKFGKIDRVMDNIQDKFGENAIQRKPI